jgi:hypothetical protein
MEFLLNCIVERVRERYERKNYSNKLLLWAEDSLKKAGILYIQ